MFVFVFVNWGVFVVLGPREEVQHDLRIWMAALTHAHRHNAAAGITANTSSPRQLGIHPPPPSRRVEMLPSTHAQITSLTGKKSRPESLTVEISHTTASVRQ